MNLTSSGKKVNLKSESLFLQAKTSEGLYTEELKQRKLIEEALGKEREVLKNMKMERDNTLREVEELRRKQGEGTSTNMPQFFSEFSFSEIEEATRNFDLSLKIGEGGYGSIYKGLLRYTQVAIKMLHAHSMQGPSEFQQEVR